MATPLYTVWVVDRTGARQHLIRSAVVDHYDFEVSAPGSAAIRVPNSDPRASAIVLIDTELQIWQDKVLKWWGVPVRRELTNDLAALKYDCQGLGWYLGKRYIGGPITPIFFDDFSSGSIANWTETDASGGLTVAADPGGPTSTTNSIYLQETNALVDDFVYHNVTGLSAQTVYVCEAYAYITQYGPLAESPYPTFLATSIDKRGLFMYDVTNFNAERQSVLQAFSQLDRGTSSNPLKDDSRHPMGFWVRHAIRLKTGDIGPTTIQIRLYPCQGSVFWSCVRFYEDKSIRFITANDEGFDQADIAWQLVDFAQQLQPSPSPYYLNFTRHPSDAAHGFKRLREYRYSKPTLILRAVNELTELNDGLDWEITYDSAGNRYWRTWYPQKLRTSTQDWTLDPKSNLVKLQVKYDGESKANSITSLGDDQSEATARETAEDYSGGVLVQDVVDGLPNRYGAELKARAPALLLSRKDTPIFITAEVKDLPSMHVTDGSIQIGDVVSVTIERLPLNLRSALYRVMKVTINPGPKTATFELVKYIPGAARLGKPDLISELIKSQNTEASFSGSLQQGPDPQGLYVRDRISFSKTGTILPFIGTHRHIMHGLALARSFKDPQIQVVYVTLGTAPATTAVIVDVQVNGVSIFGTSTRPRVEPGELVGNAPAAFTLSDGDIITVSCTQGDTAATNLTVIVEFDEQVLGGEAKK